ncbi:MAG: glycoside hydrolase domain-containing protein [bacterium]
MDVRRIAGRFANMCVSGPLAGLMLLLTATGAMAGAMGPYALPPERVPAFAVPRISQPPKIDGTIDWHEWQEATAVSGVGQCGDDILLPRPTTFYLAWDPEHLYMACRIYLRANYKPKVTSGRTQGLAYVWDDGLELHWQPMGANVPGANTKNSFKWFLNCAGLIGDCSRLALGQQFKNWAPQFVIKTRLTEPGSAPNGGRWWEMEMSSTPRDFELGGAHSAGDTWRVMLGVNHIPSWLQARIPCNGGYLEPFGYNVLTLVENTPGVQMTMDSLSNLSSDGTAAMVIRAFNPTAQPVDVNVTVDVASAIKTNLTLTVPPGEASEFALNEKLPEKVRAGSAWVEVKQGARQLFRHTFNFKTGSNPLMMAPVPPPDTSKFAFETRFNPVRSWLLIKADTYYLEDSVHAKSLRYRVTAEADGKVIAEGQVILMADYYLQDVVELPQLEPGKYRVEAFMELVEGKVLGPMTGQFEKKDEASEFARWWGKKVGDVERVLAPYTAIRKVRVPGGAEAPGVKGTGREERKSKPVNVPGFSLLGREYALDALGLPVAIRSAGESVLSGPARIVVLSNGKETVIPVGAAKITEHKDWRVRFEGKASGGGLDFTASGWLEQDGLVYVDLTYQPSGDAVRVDAMRIEFPLSEKDADCLLCIGPGENYSSRTTMLLPDEKQGRLWSTLDTGITGCGMGLGSFYPTVWVGSERRGFLWWADNDKGWVQDDTVPAHEVVREKSSAGEVNGATGTSVVLRNHIVAKPIKMRGPRTVSFSYMATPFKPMPKGFRTTITTEDGTFWIPFRGVRKDSKTGQLVQPPISGHVNWIHPESRYPEEWPALWAEQKAQADSYARQHQWYDPYRARSGINFTHMSFQIMGYGRKSLENDVYSYFGSEWEAGHWDTWNETYTDYAMTLFEPAFKDGGVRHTYWDLAFPIHNGDLLSGLAYRLPDGRVQPGYNGWNIRRFMMRLWSLMLDAGIVPGGNGFHSTNAYLPIAMPWVDAVTDAELPLHLDSSPLDWVDKYPPERMRAMSVCHSWGVAIAWMSLLESKDNGKKVSAARSQAQWVWMHESWLNNWISVNHMPILSTMPESVLDWGVNAADTVYNPYWRNPYATCADKDVLVSLWQTPGEGHVTLGIFNFDGKAARDAAVTVDLAKLGLTAGQVCARTLFADSDGTTAELDSSTGIVRVKALQAHKIILVGLAVSNATEIARATKAIPAWVAGGLPAAVVDFGLVRKETKHYAPGRARGVTCDDPAIRIGMWLLPDRIMLSVFNSDEKQARGAAVKIDLGKLDLVPELVWQEFVRVRQFYAEANAPAPVLDFYGRTLKVDAIPPGCGRLIAIRRY